MSVLRPPACPYCGSTEFHEFARVEADGVVGPPVDMALYECDNDDCRREFDSEEARA